MAAATTSTETKKPAYGRKTLRKIGRVKRKAKLAGDKEYAAKYFEAKSKRSTDKKAAFKKKKSGKK